MRPKLLPLSETMHLIMLALRKPLHGYAIMQLVNEMSSQHRSRYALRCTG